MNKKFFIHSLALDDKVTSGLHQLAFILEIDGELKAAYHYLIKPEGCTINYQYVRDQGYDPNFLNDNPMYNFQVYNNLEKVLERYINSFSDENSAVIYCFTSDEFYKLKNFFEESGSDFHKYFTESYCEIRSLLIDKLKGDAYTVELEDFIQYYDPNNHQRDAMSILTSIYKIYKELNGKE